MKNKKNLKKKNSSTIEKLIYVAQQEFAKKGFVNTTVEDITQKAGVAKGTYYLYFKTKEDVIKYMIKKMTKSITKILKDGINKIKKSEEKNFKKLIRNIFVETLTEYHNYKDIMTIIAHSKYVLSKSMDSFKKRHLKQIEKSIKEIINIGIKKGFLRKIKIDIVTQAVFIMVMYYSIEVLFFYPKEKLSNIIEEIIDLIFYGIGKN